MPPPPRFSCCLEQNRPKARHTSHPCLVAQRQCFHHILERFHGKVPYGQRQLRQNNWWAPPCYVKAWLHQWQRVRFVYPPKQNGKWGKALCYWKHFFRPSSLHYRFFTQSTTLGVPIFFESLRPICLLKKRIWCNTCCSMAKPLIAQDSSSHILHEALGAPPHFLDVHVLWWQTSPGSLWTRRSSPDHHHNTHH